MSLLVGLRVSSRSPPGQDHQTDAALRQIRLDGQQFGRAARQPVRLGDGEHVAQECEALGKLQPLCGARYLLVEDAVAGRPESRSCAASPAPWSMVDVRAYPTIMALRRPRALGT
jgi:hypothetical protein